MFCLWNVAATPTKCHFSSRYEFGGVSESSISSKSHIKLCILRPDGLQSLGKALRCVLRYDSTVLGRKQCLWLLGDGSVQERQEAILTHSPHTSWNYLSTFVCWTPCIGSRYLLHVAVYQEEGLFGKPRVERWRNHQNYIFVCTCFPEVVKWENNLWAPHLAMGKTTCLLFNL